MVVVESRFVSPVPDRFFVQRPGEGEPISWRAEMFVKAAAPATGGAFSLIETVNPPDAGPPWHLHRSADEAFYVLDGDYEFWCGEQRVDASAGWFVFLPREVPHRYRAGPGGGRVLMLSLQGVPRTTSKMSRSPCRTRRRRGTCLPVSLSSMASLCSRSTDRPWT